MVISNYLIEIRKIAYGVIRSEKEYNMFYISNLINMYKKHSNFYILTCDISKYFYSINHYFYLIHQDKEYLKYCLKQIKLFLEKEKVNLNDKTNIYSISNGFTFIGYKYIFKNYNGYLKFDNNNNFYFKMKG